MDPIIEIKSLHVGFPIRSGIFQRIRDWNRVLVDINLTIARGQTLGLVGESGCGKTTLGRAILGLVAIQQGEILYRSGKLEKSVELTKLPEKAFRPLRKNLQIVFQDPYSSLNPRMMVEQILTEALRCHFPGPGKEGWRKKCLETLDHVGLARDSMRKYPHEFSGGQRQRISIARALALEPEFIVCDECVSALDVSIQAQIINLLIDLQNQFGLSYLFISHDLSVVRHISHEIAVIDHGRIVEKGPADQVSESPSHDYTKKLISAVPSLVPAMA